jgi:hypothetical protein
MKKIWKFHRWVKDPATDTWREPGYARAGRRPSGGTLRHGPRCQSPAQGFLGLSRGNLRRSQGAGNPVG